MNTRDFCIWFKGFLDVTRASQLETIQLDIVKKQLEITIKEANEAAGVVNYYDQIKVPMSNFRPDVFNQSFHQGT
jgi:hypothetical protein